MRRKEKTLVGTLLILVIFFDGSARRLFLCALKWAFRFNRNVARRLAQKCVQRPCVLLRVWPKGDGLISIGCIIPETNIPFIGNTLGTEDLEVEKHLDTSVDVLADCLFIVHRSMPFLVTRCTMIRTLATCVRVCIPTHKTRLPCVWRKRGKRTGRPKRE